MAIFNRKHSCKKTRWETAQSSIHTAHNEFVLPTSKQMFFSRVCIRELDAQCFNDAWMLSIGQHYSLSVILSFSFHVHILYIIYTQYTTEYQLKHNLCLEQCLQRPPLLYFIILYPASEAFHFLCCRCTCEFWSSEGGKKKAVSHTVCTKLILITVVSHSCSDGTVLTEMYSAVKDIKIIMNMLIILFYVQKFYNGFIFEGQ